VFLANGTDGLRVYDISDPADPKNIGHANDGYATTVAAFDNRVFVDVGGLRAYDVTSPDDPDAMGFVPITSPSVEDFAVSGNHVYVANSGAGLKIFDVSGPGNPVQVGAINNGGFAKGVTVSGDYAYLANYTDGLRVYDVSNPAQPVNVGHVDSGGAAQDVVVSGNHVYVANSNDGLRIYAVMPQLSMQLTSTNTLLLSWSAPAAFALQQNPTLASGSWAAVTNLPTPVGARSQVVLLAPTGNVFYRLVSE
jgi:hypothetical protein